MKPLPAIHVPSLEAKLAAIKVVYENSWRLNKRSYEVAKECATLTPHPYIVLCDDRSFWFNACAYFSSPFGNTYGGILINSPKQLVAYCRTLGDRGPKST